MLLTVPLRPEETAPEPTAPEPTAAEPTAPACAPVANGPMSPSRGDAIVVQPTTTASSTAEAPRAVSLRSHLLDAPIGCLLDRTSGNCIGRECRKIVAPGWVDHQPEITSQHGVSADDDS